MIVEDRARSTAENATYTRELVSPKPGQRWLLVTSAMPRSIGCFRKAGFPVEAYPVNYTTTGRRSDWTLSDSIGGGLKRTDAALHEWIGLIAYRLSGRTDHLFPAPRK